MKIFHKAYKGEVRVSAVADMAKVAKAAKETITENLKPIYLPDGRKNYDRLTYAGHKGLDTVGSVGANIYATHSGIVSHVITVDDAGSGYWLEISRDGRYSYVAAGVDSEQYKHLKQGSITVKRGQYVKEGDKIGVQGWSGNVIPKSPAGEHLHYEVRRNGELVDPLPYAMGTSHFIQEGLRAHNANDLRLVMITALGYMYEDTAKRDMAKIIEAMPELKAYAGIRVSPTSSAGKYQIVLARYQGTLADARAVADSVTERTGKTVEVWTW